MVTRLRSSTAPRVESRREHRRIYLFFAWSTIQKAIPLSEGARFSASLEIQGGVGPLLL
jgi:hypothetical protein